ncbi:MAG: hypothetical protein AAB724_03250 [Patescibacteria group bacterium]
MPKIAFLTLILPLLFAPKAPIFAQETPIANTTFIDQIELPNTPLSPFFDKWIRGDLLKQKAQEIMKKAQQELSRLTQKAIQKVQDASKAEIKRQADQRVQDLQNTGTQWIGRTKAIIKEITDNIANKIKIFFSNSSD